MSGVTIIGALLEVDAAVIGKVPAERHKAGKLPDGIDVPALLVRSVSTVERHRLKRGAIVRTTERVSVTVRAGNYRDQRDITKLVRKACSGKIGTIADYANVSVLSAGTGPDILGPGNTFEQAQDFRVGFDEPA